MSHSSIGRKRSAVNREVLGSTPSGTALNQRLYRNDKT